MPRKHKGRQVTPPNLAARSLAEAQNRLRIVKSRKLYTRKIKHQNRDRDPGSFVLGGMRARSLSCRVFEAQNRYPLLLKTL